MIAQAIIIIITTSVIIIITIIMNINTAYWQITPPLYLSTRIKMIAQAIIIIITTTTVITRHQHHYNPSDYGLAANYHLRY